MVFIHKSIFRKTAFRECACRFSVYTISNFHMGDIFPDFDNYACNLCADWRTCEAH